MSWRPSNYFLENHYKTVKNLSEGKDGWWTPWVNLARNKLKTPLYVQLIYKENSLFKRSTSNWLSFWHSLPWCHPCNLHELPQWLLDAKQSYPEREQAISGTKEQMISWLPLTIPELNPKLVDQDGILQIIWSMAIFSMEDVPTDRRGHLPIEQQTQRSTEQPTDVETFRSSNRPNDQPDQAGDEHLNSLLNLHSRF